MISQFLDIRLGIENLTTMFIDLLPRLEANMMASNALHDPPTLDNLFNTIIAYS